MDFFEWQAELAKQWLCLAGQTVETALNASMALASAAMPPPNETETVLTPWPSPPDMSWTWPAAPAQLANQFGPNPFAQVWPWTAWPIPQMPWGQSPSFLPFMPMSLLPGMASLPAMASLMPASLTPWPFGSTTWPLAATFLPSGGFGSSPALFGAPTAWLLPVLPQAAAFPGWQPPPPTATDMLEQVAAAYRTAGGHAVAIVLGPMGAPLDPRSYGQPWWNSPARYASF